MHLNKGLGNLSVLNVCLIALSGCGAESPADAEGIEATIVEEQSSALTTDCDATVAAGDGWINRPVTSENGEFSASWRSSVSADVSGAQTLDAVVGLSNDPAAAFSDLGPILRFNQNGSIDVRDGNGYVGAFPYRFYDGSYDFQMLVNVPNHRYSVWVRHLDSPFKPFEVLAKDAAFRTEQQSVASLGQLATIVDSPSGEIQHCRYSHEANAGCAKSGPGAWQSRPFTTLGNSQFMLDFYTWVTAPSVDAVVGASLGAPSSFTDLAAIVRFRPDGFVDARNGSTYAAQASFSYVPNTYYHVNIELDLARSVYSVRISTPAQLTVVIAQDYAFRSERSGVPSLDHLAQFVDSSSGEVSSCALVAH